MSSRTFTNKNSQEQVSPGFEFFKGVGQVAGATLLSVTLLSSSIIAGSLVGLAISFRNLPDVRQLRSFSPTETTFIYDIKGKLLASIHGEANRQVVPLDRISPNLKRAVLASEDGHFYGHHGINPSGVGRALVVNLVAGGVKEGGSTITMQLVKNLFLSHKRAFTRKLAEAVLAIRLEQILEKNEILEMYLNQVYWGHNNYGAQTAARTYFNKSAEFLTLGESAMMAGLIQAPEEFSPFVSMKKAKQKQREVLGRMRELDWITSKEYDQAINEKITLGRIRSFQGSALPYISNTVAQELSRRFGRDALLKGGMRVQTTVDAKFQIMAESTVSRWHQDLLGKGLRKNQIALVAIDPRTHFVKALVGGVDAKASEFNRATQAQRQPGSSFKPFVYYAAFATGKYTPDSTILDAPVSYRDGNGWYYPRNYDGGFSGAMSIRTALAQSRNIPVIKLGKSIGMNKVVETCRTLGIMSPMEPVTSLPLGAIGVTPLEMASAYATFANYGWQSPATVIVRITDSSGNVILDNTPKPQRVLDSWASAATIDIMQSVVTSGTGKGAALGRPSAGKTGTTSSEKDIWYVGTVPQLTTAVWVGRDDNLQLSSGATGGGMVAPIWRDFMVQALENVPVENFKSPSQFPRPKSN
ncbi:penicillin-binding protein [Cylindrospermopsis raciborskii S07]|uniref:Penicillin-binding protein n=2 Tax=Cylindrospermopsis raciborskii TaxID=77022 RepID=A0A853MGH4_9CYAN|nr:transglycosylase domain-containing protein [Cylindrospermopsis raciborskii]MBA4445705.1 penicillin-binding protein [Cylindrospermopsis raciborskii CS-506_C]MBA4449941.1 penicillin-binding protein [Cylindrospermopsis raciborskii CS-506_D]MBA4456551.1 penicillin-binding protein [Cylindrospermopsis raciborskii CS-506_B]MBA4465911.1 penicillin-binding protein [Cylindrospermopsis raciborskii CS-506_A]MBU6345131.1 penicillin-binding protein [Cyanobacteria bacterium REEB494]MCH4905114.1 PBP1A fam